MSVCVRTRIGYAKIAAEHDSSSEEFGDRLRGVESTTDGAAE
jgi:hypothetical protein